MHLIYYMQCKYNPEWPLKLLHKNKIPVIVPLKSSILDWGSEWEVKYS